MLARGDTLKDQTEYYINSCRIVSRAHYMISQNLDRRHFVIGIPVLIVTTFVGTAIFTTIQNDTGFLLKLIAGIASFLAALLSGLQTLLNYSSRAERHRIAGAKYASLRRKFSLYKVKYLTDGEQSGSEAVEKFQELVETLSKLGEEMPAFSDKYWAQAYAEAFGASPLAQKETPSQNSN